MAMAKFDAKDGDDLYLWSRDRSAYLSAGNMSSARTLANSGYGNAMAGLFEHGHGDGSGIQRHGHGRRLLPLRHRWNPAMWTGFSGGWYYNPYLNMYSFMPFAGTMYSPFGYGYYNPVTIGYVYTPGYYWKALAVHGPEPPRRASFSTADDRNHEGYDERTSAATARDDCHRASVPCGA